ncbi:hypothetical protein [Shewanella aestuarii]|uniref:Uncharacterized protein n=1 Tax=Shewanella aestuarii TaxID=1028752 RepID=A0A6G9QNF2_9GAMM|nr:hypothetical protein [Shewanella aestuarii]QIR15369.1 hypothetical protein HBH39_13430 [Shewanella aestuarii]
MKKLLVLSALLISMQVSAKSLPPILEYLPNCTPNLIEGIYIETKYNGSSNDKLVESAFHLVRQKAKEKRVDAVIITNLIETNKIIVTADLIDYCDEDDSLSSVSTAYNRLSRKPISLQRTTTQPQTQIAKASQSQPVKKSINSIDLPATTRTEITRTEPNRRTSASVSSTIPRYTEKQLADLASQVSLKSSNVTLSSAYGVSIDDSTNQLINTLGPASAIFTLNDQTNAWLYGRELWFIVKNETVKKITYKERSVLNFTGKNLISYDEKFDNNWRIDDKATYRDDVAKVNRQLNYLKRQTKDQYIVSNQSNILTLDFNEFSSYYDDASELLLTGFNFQSRDFDQGKVDILFSDIKHEKLYDLLIPSNDPQPQKLDTLVTRYVPNIINFSDSGMWEVLSKNIQVKHKNNIIKQVKLSESINYPVESDAEFMRFLNKLKIPATRKAMLDHFNGNVTTWLEKISVSRDGFVLKAEFTSEDDDAMLISLDVEYL